MWLGLYISPRHYPQACTQLPRLALELSVLPSLDTTSLHWNGRVHLGFAILLATPAALVYRVLLACNLQLLQHNLLRVEIHGPC